MTERSEAVIMLPHRCILGIIDNISPVHYDTEAVMAISVTEIVLTSDGIRKCYCITNVSTLDHSATETAKTVTHGRKLLIHVLLLLLFKDLIRNI